MKSRKYILFFLLPALVATACTPSGRLAITDAWTRPAAKGGNGAAYFKVDNRASGNDVILGVSSVIADSTEVHMSMVDSNDVMSMTHLENIPVPAGEEVIFEPGGLHVMLIGLKQDLAPGDSFTLTLILENAGSMDFQVTVEEP